MGSDSRFGIIVGEFANDFSFGGRERVDGLGGDGVWRILQTLLSARGLRRLGAGVDGGFQLWRILQSCPWLIPLSLHLPRLRHPRDDFLGEHPETAARAASTRVSMGVMGGDDASAEFCGMSVRVPC